MIPKSSSFVTYFHVLKSQLGRSELEKHIDTARTKQKAKELQRSWSVTKETTVQATSRDSRAGS